MKVLIGLVIFLVALFLITYFILAITSPESANDFVNIITGNPHP